MAPQVSVKVTGGTHNSMAPPSHFLQRVYGRVLAAMGAEVDIRLNPLPAEYGPGNALLLTLEHEHVTEVFSGFGEKAVRAETVAKQTLERARRYVASGAAVSEWLADQVMLPMALAGGGSFTADKLSLHALTNAEVIARFLPVRFDFESTEHLHTVRVTSIAKRLD